MTDFTIKQIEREAESARSGYEKFKKQEKRNEQIGNASTNVFGASLLSVRHELIIDNIIKLSERYQGSKCVPIREALEHCAPTCFQGKEHNLINFDVWAYLGFKEVLDNLFNKNQMPSGKLAGKFGGDKNLTVAKSLSELELEVGRTIRNEMGLSLIQAVFPKWFRVADKFAKHSFEGAIRSSPATWNTKMRLSLSRFADKLEAEGDKETAAFVRNRKVWTTNECRVIGELVITSVLMANTDFLSTKTIQVGKKKRTEIVLTAAGIDKKAELAEEVKKYTHDLLPMVIEPIPLTNEQLGGWLNPSLQENEDTSKGNIKLSDRHLEFINRQMRVKFEINPFTKAIVERLIAENRSLGKFICQVTDAISPAQLLGINSTDKDERDRLFYSHSKSEQREARRTSAKLKNEAFKQGQQNVISMRLVNMMNTLSNDDYFYIPMKYCFRGRIYSRVAFLSFQGTDAGKYLLRFKKKTPCDDYTLKWLKRGIANAGGQDKKSWDRRESWFDRNVKEIINVGRMTTTGDFERAYDFLTSDTIDDPFAFAALSEEYVKVFVDKTQDYTQCFVTIDASCSGTSIFNAWRLNATGAAKTNLVNTPYPADIYMEVWHEIKKLLPEGSVRKVQIERVEASKLLRKMMKTTYVPASYASPVGEQLIKLKAFNDEYLVNAGIGFKDSEIKAIQDVWSVALDTTSSINTIVNWFRSRTKEAVKSGATEVVITNSVGSTMTLEYPKTFLQKVGVVGNPQAKTRRKSIHVDTDKPDLKKLLSSVTANVTHFTDAAALVEALWDFELPFVAIHDAVGFAPSHDLEEGLDKLRYGLMKATEHNVWESFLDENNLPLNHLTAPPIIGDLDLEDVLSSSYIFS